MTRRTIAFAFVAVLSQAVFAADEPVPSRTYAPPATTPRPARAPGAEEMLKRKINVHFEAVPLKQAIEMLHAETGINMVIDSDAIRDANVNMDRPYSLDLHGVRVGTVLYRLLSNAQLAHVVDNEVVVITTLENARPKMKQVTYNVAELIVPVRNCELPVTPAPRYLLPAEKMARKKGILPSESQAAAVPRSEKDEKAETARNADILVHVIVNTVAPDTWSNVGGKGRITYSPKDMSLVVNQTQDVQEQIQELICGLKRQFREIRIDAKLVETTKRGGAKTKTMPALTFFDEQTVCLFVTENLTSSSPSDLNVGIAIQLRTQTVSSDKVLLEIFLKRNELDRLSRDGVTVLGRIVQTVQTVELGKPLRLILERDAGGSPRQWLEFTLRDVTEHETAGERDSN